MRLTRIKTRKIKNFLKKLLRTLAERAFLTFLVLFLVALISGGIIFYKYNILIKKTKIEIVEKPLQFKEKNYQDVLKIWQEKEKKSQETDLKIYPDPFR